MSAPHLLEAQDKKFFYLETLYVQIINIFAGERRLDEHFFSSSIAQPLTLTYLGTIFNHILHSDYLGNLFNNENQRIPLYQFVISNSHSFRNAGEMSIYSLSSALIKTFTSRAGKRVHGYDIALH